MSQRPLLSRDISLEDKLSLIHNAAKEPGLAELELLVLLSSDPNEQVRQTAQEVIRQLPDERYIQVLATPSLEPWVARYFLDPTNARAAVLPILLAHPDTPQDAIATLAARASPELIPTLLDQLDLLTTPALVALKENPAYLNWQKDPPATEGIVVEVDLLEMLIQESQSERSSLAWEEQLEAEPAADSQHEGLIRRLAKMTVAQRVKLALMGNREERALLIRDPGKVVARAVLGSPKLTESEVESFAAMKNLSQEILRLISMNRKFMKNYTVVKNLASNPRLPIDVALPLLHRLMLNDLRVLAGSKDIPDVTRKMAVKLYKARQP